MTYKFKTVKVNSKTNLRVEVNIESRGKQKRSSGCKTKVDVDMT